ncbi:MAG TPA: hypothetical protein VFC23_14665 [Thermoanaerobaculia bacterium]|nr:hypothetical protein [Thermoanaerobaculia bacterium]
MENTVQKVESPGAATHSEEQSSIPLPDPELKPERVQEALRAAMAADRAHRVRSWGWSAMPDVGGFVRVKKFGSARVAAMYALFATEHAQLAGQHVSVSIDSLGQVAVLLLAAEPGLTEKGCQFARDLG